MSTIFLTGGSGMVGRNLREAPWAREHRFVAPSSRELDLRNGAAVEAFLGDLRPDLVIHAAGRVGGIQANLTHPVDFLVDNLDMGRNVVLGAWKAGVRRLLNLGSSCMYPRDSDEPLREERVLTGELEPTNEGYALAKIVTARLCDYLGRQQGDLRYRTLIPCNLYGRWDAFEGERSHMIPAALVKLDAARRAGLPDVEVWGDGSARREFMYAGDLAAFVGLALERFDELPPLLNVGLGQDFSIDEYYRAAAGVVGFEGGLRHDLSRPVGMRRKLCDGTRLRAFGWAAPTSLREGLERTYAFYREGRAAR